MARDRLYGEADKSSATLQFASVDSQSDAERIAQRVRGGGLQAYVQAGPGGMGYVVRSQVCQGSGHGVHRHPPVARAGLQERSGVAPMNAALQATAGAAA